MDAFGVLLLGLFIVGAALAVLAIDDDEDAQNAKLWRQILEQHEAMKSQAKKK